MRRYGGVWSEASGMNATSTAGRSLKGALGGQLDVFDIGSTLSESQREAGLGSESRVFSKMRGGVSTKRHHCRGERPEGERSPREHRAAALWQHSAAATDSLMEQGLEVEGGVSSGTGAVATLVLGSGPHAGSGSEKHFGVEGDGGRHPTNSEEATAAVTQYGHQ